MECLSTSLISSLPDEVLLNILRHLSVGQLCQSRRVCRKWRELILDNKLWSSIVVPARHLSANSLHRLLRCYLGEHTKALYLHGDPRMTKKNVLTPTVLTLLNKQCASLRSLTLDCIDLHSVIIDTLPASLKVLKIKRCVIQKPFSKSLTFLWQPTRLHNLEEFDFGGTSQLTKEALFGVMEFPALERLSVHGCVRISDLCSSDIERLSSLTHLNASQMKFSQLHLMNMSRVMVSLKSLIIMDIQVVPLPDQSDEERKATWLALWRDGFPSLQTLHWSASYLLPGTHMECVPVSSIPLQLVQDMIPKIKNYQDSNNAIIIPTHCNDKSS